MHLDAVTWKNTQECPSTLSGKEEEGSHKEDGTANGAGHPGE